MTPHSLVMGRKPRVLDEAVHQTFGAQPICCYLARGEPDFAQALKNYRDIGLKAMAAGLGDAGRRHLIDIIGKKPPLVFLRLKERESSLGGKEVLLKFIPTFIALRELVR